MSAITMDQWNEIFASKGLPDNVERVEQISEAYCRYIKICPELYHSPNFNELPDYRDISKKTLTEKPLQVFTDNKIPFLNTRVLKRDAQRRLNCETSKAKRRVGNMFSFFIDGVLFISYSLCDLRIDKYNKDIAVVEALRKLERPKFAKAVFTMNDEFQALVSNSKETKSIEGAIIETMFVNDHHDLTSKHLRLLVNYILSDESNTIFPSTIAYKVDKFVLESINEFSRNQALNINKVVIAF